MYPSAVPSSEGISLRLGTEAAYELPNGAISPSTAPRVMSVPQAKNSTLSPAVLIKSV